MSLGFFRADNLPFDSRPQLSRIFVEGFYIWLKHFSKDKQILTHAFTHIFNLQYFYVAVEGENIAAMVACTQGFAPIKLERKAFVAAMGFLRGNFAYFMLNRHMIRNSYPFALSPKTGSIEFVATAPEYRSRGIAHDLILYTINQNPYDAYVLEVAETNRTAFGLYQRLGFTEIKRVKAPRSSGAGNFIYMRKLQEE